MLSAQEETSAGQFSPAEQVPLGQVTVAIQLPEPSQWQELPEHPVLPKQASSVPPERTLVSPQPLVQVGSLHMLSAQEETSAGQFSPAEQVPLGQVGLTVKLAVTDLTASIVTVQEPVPEQPPPDQPEKPEPAAAVALNVTEVPEL
jgi:hypothetical protein